MNMILLSSDQAAQVTGNYGDFSALQPVQIDTGDYVLPPEVLTNPDFNSVFDLLSSLSQVDVTFQYEDDQGNLYYQDGDPITPVVNPVTPPADDSGVTPQVYTCTWPMITPEVTTEDVTPETTDQQEGTSLLTSLSNSITWVWNGITRVWNSITSLFTS
jgi:hypothetical protein